MVEKLKVMEKVKVSCHLLCQLCGADFHKEFDISTLVDDLRGCSCPKCGADWRSLNVDP